MAEDLFVWGASAELPESVILILMAQGVTSVSQLRQLSDQDVDTFFQIPGLLLRTQCTSLKAAIRRLSASSEASSYNCRATTNDRTNDDVRSMRMQRTDVHRRQKQEHSARHHSDDGERGDSGDGRSGEELQITQAQTAATVREDAPREHCSLNQSRSASARTWDDDFVDVGTGKEETVRLLLLGKTGSGKSTTGNTIFGQKLFNTAPDFGSVTSECERHVGLRGDTRIEIMDSPGLYDTHKTHEEICTIIVQAVAGMHPGPHAVLYVIRVGRFTAEEYNAYGRLKALFDDSITGHIILLFTHGDELERQGVALATLMASPSTPDNLKKVFRECGLRCQLFNNLAADPQPQVDKLLAAVRKLVAANNGRPYSCPKYSKIGEGMEEEVNRRLVKFEKRDLEQRKYVQELEKQTREAEQAAEKTRREFHRKEQQREQEARKEEERRKKTERVLEQQLRQHQCDLEKQREELERLRQERAQQERQRRRKEEQVDKEEQRRLKKQAEEADRRERTLKEKLQEQQLHLEEQKRQELAERRRMEKERLKLQKEHETQRRQDMLEMDRRNQEREKRMARQWRKEREAEERRDRERRREMELLKDRVVKKEKPGFLDKFVSFVRKPVRAFLNLFSGND